MARLLRIVSLIAVAFSLLVFPGLAYAVDSAGLTHSDLQSFTPNVVPVGAILLYAGKNAPAGYFVCNGQSFNASQFTGLVNTLGTNITPNMSAGDNVGMIYIIKHD